MTIEIFDCPQNSDEWYEARRGIPTASEFSTILAKDRDGRDSVTRRTYLYRLAGERITGEPFDSYVSAAMIRGKSMEKDARTLYAYMADDPIECVGFLRNVEARTGCSPDALVGSAGMAEFKTAYPHVLIPLLLSGKFPPEHKAQCQGGLWIAEREWIDLMVYWPGMPPHVVRVTRDEEYIAQLAVAVAQFNAELDAVVERIEARRAA